VQVELARAMGERVHVVADIQRSRDAEQQLYEYLRQPGRTAPEMAHVAQFGSLHRQQLYNLAIKLRQYDKGVELIRARLTTARAKREVLDRLRENDLAAWHVAARHEEQAELDEIATMRAARRAQDTHGQVTTA